MYKQVSYAVIRHNAPAVNATFGLLDEAVAYAEKLAADYADSELDYVEQPNRFVWNLYCDGDLVDQVFIRKVRITIELD